MRKSPVMLGPGTFALLLGALTSCPFFTSGDYYTKDVSRAPVDAHSARYIDSMVDAGDTGGFWAAADPVEFINIANAGTPRRRVLGKVAYHRFDTPYPWADTFRIEPLSDAHAIVVDTRTCEVYESYQTAYADGTLTAYSGAHWNLRRPFAPLPGGAPSAMASGLSLFAGMIRWEEVQSGHIDHALNWEAPAGTVAQWDYVRPASDTDRLAFKGNSSYQLPYGAHLRLRASFDLSHFGPQSRAIAMAMKRYGIFLADTGSDDNGLYNAMPLDGQNHWDAGDLAALRSIHITDFEVLRLGSVSSVR
ncbi:MAG TPA: hypothetical protein VKT72_08210 [Candidatus Baltobacteraceae bacterium]|nr:hypothetical protein [Candidatus Baltobacteraceae bacterium]